jgi:hypothetical protein
MAAHDQLLAILDLARWAPSGDNTQPWRFEIVADDHIAVHGYDTRDHVVYDFEGHPSHMAHGALLETLRIAATQYGLASRWLRRVDTPDTAPIYDVKLTAVTGLAPDPLIPFIKTRTVQRRPMRTTPLTNSQREALRGAVGLEYEIHFFESFAERRKIAALLWDNAYIRLTCPEAYPVHRDIIEWDTRYSKDRIPAAAIGVDPLTAKLMRWVMQDWKRVEFFNRYLLGTVAPRMQLDVLPSILCAAHVLIRATKLPVTLEQHVKAGIAMQRMWLTAASCGLHLQPEMTPVIFRWYVRAGRRFSSSTAALRRGEALATQFEQKVGLGQDDAFVFFCRVGHSRIPASRSVRRDLQELLVTTTGRGGEKKPR